MSVSASVIHVPGDYATIQAGIDAAGDGDTVLLADGTYSGEGNYYLEWSDKVIQLISENGREHCFIDGKNNPDSTIIVLFNGDIDIDTIISGITFQNCIAGMSLNKDSPTFMNCTIDSSIYAVLSNENHPQFFNCVFSGTTGPYVYTFAALDFLDSSPLFENCLFTNNCTEDPDEGTVGAMYISGSEPYSDLEPIIRNCTFSNNYSRNGPAAIFSSSSTLILENCIFQENASSGYWGGTALARTSTYRNCLFKDNEAVWYGGAAYAEFARFEKCVFDGNRANKGGAIFIPDNLQPKFDGCIFRYNFGEYGGAVYSDWGWPNIENCLFHENGYIYSLGGAVYILSTNFAPGTRYFSFTNNVLYIYYAQDAAFTIYNLSSEINISNSIFYGNDPAQITCGAPEKFHVFHCNVEGGYPGYNNIDADPMFTGPYEFQLQPGSPCIDAGYGPGSPESDFFGNPRPGGVAVDIGIHEVDGGSQVTRPFIQMPHHIFTPEDPCFCTVTVLNTGDAPIENQPLFVILEIAGLYFFAPDFSDFNYYDGVYPPTTTEIPVLETFSWPEDAGIGNARWYAAFTDPDITMLTSPLAVWDFSWHE